MQGERLAMKTFRRRISWATGVLILLFSAAYANAEATRLTVQSRPPGAEVYLNGRNTNVKTPARLMVEPGQHRVRLVKKGYHPLSRTVEVYSSMGFANFNLKPVGEKIAVENYERKSTSHHQPRRPASSIKKTSRQDPEKNAKASTETRRYEPVRNVKIIKRGTYQKSGRKKRHSPRTLNALPENNPFNDWIEKNSEKKRAKAKPLPKPQKTEEEGKLPFFPLVEEKKDTANNTEKDLTNKKGSQTEGRQGKASLETRSEDPASSSLKSPAAIQHDRPSSSAATEEAGPSVGNADGEDEAPLVCAPDPESEWPSSAESVLYDSARGLPRFPEKFNVLLLGLDRRDRRGILATGAKIPLDKLRKKPANADVIMVFQIDFLENRVRVVSIPRDTRVYIPRRGHRKINAAYAYGRERLSRQVVESFLDIEIHRVVTADWRGAKKSISIFKRLGLDYNGYSEKEMFWHLRKRSFRRGDFRRIERQQKFMRYACAELLRLYNETRQSKGTSAMVKNNLLDMAIKQGLKELITDFTEEEIHILAYAMRDYDFRDMLMGKVKGRGGRRHGRYYYFPYRNHSFDHIVASLE